MASKSTNTGTGIKLDKKTQALFFVYASVAIDILGLSVVVPTLPFLAIHFNASAEQIGYVYTGYALAAMFSGLYSGWISDRYGRRPALLLSLFGSFVGFMLQGLANDIDQFILFRFVSGAFGGSATVAFSYIADVVQPKDRPKYMGLVGVVISLAFMVGPGIGSGLAEFTLQTPMFVSCGLAGFGFLLSLKYLKEPSELMGDKERAHLKAKEDDHADEVVTRERRKSTIAMTLDDDVDKAIAAATAKADAEVAAAIAAPTPVAPPPGEADGAGADGDGDGDGDAAGADADGAKGDKDADDGAAKDASAEAKDGEYAGDAAQDALAAAAQSAAAGAGGDGGGDAEEAGDKALLEEEKPQYAPVTVMLAVVLLYGCSFAGIQVVGALRMQERFGWTALEIGFQMMSNATLLTFTQLVVFPFWNKKLTLTGAASLGLALFGLGQFIIGAAPAGSQWTASAGYWTTFHGFGLVAPVPPAYLSTKVPKSMSGRVMGASQFAQSLGQIIGPVVIAAIYAIDTTMAFTTSAVIAWTSAFLLIVGTCLPDIRAARKAQAAEQILAEKDKAADFSLATEPAEEWASKYSTKLVETLRHRNWALKYQRARDFAEEIIEDAIPFLPEKGDERMIAINELSERFHHGTPFPQVRAHT